MPCHVGVTHWKLGGMPYRHGADRIGYRRVGWEVGAVSSAGDRAVYRLRGAVVRYERAVVRYGLGLGALLVPLMRPRGGPLWGPGGSMMPYGPAEDMPYLHIFIWGRAEYRLPQSDGLSTVASWSRFNNRL